MLEVDVAVKTVVCLVRVLVTLTSAKLFESSRLVPVRVIDRTEEPATVAEEVEIAEREGELL